jgi:hypothetical protein
MAVQVGVSTVAETLTSDDWSMFDLVPWQPATTHPAKRRIKAANITQRTLLFDILHPQSVNYFTRLLKR